MTVDLALKKLLAVFILCFFAALPAGALEARYTVKIGESYQHWQVNVCFKDTVPEALFNGHWSNNDTLIGAKTQHGKNLKRSRHRLLLGGVKAGECIDYKVKLPNSKRHIKSLYRSGDDMIVDNSLWLWQPKGLSSDDKVTISFLLADNLSVSTPWLDTDERHTFRLTSTPYHWDSRIAIGRFIIHQLPIGNQILKVAILNSSAKRQDEYLQWIAQAALAIHGVFGAYPVHRAQIVITPIGSRSEAVPWGEVQRGGSIAAHFFVDSFRPIDEFKADWTAAHELSHMFVPYIARNELYLSEGIASYYQNVARAKQGMLTPEQAWDKLLAGFKRGIRSSRRELLAHDPASMQMYWGGAALYLMADVELRKRSGGKQTLASVLKRLSQCCRPSNKSWSGAQLMTKLDKLSQTKVFSELYYQQARARRFPDLKPVLQALGFDSFSRIPYRPLSKDALAIMR